MARSKNRVGNIELFMGPTEVGCVAPINAMFVFSDHP